MTGTTVRIIKNWDFPDWRRMSPGSAGVWDGIRFTEDEVADPDYVLVLNQPHQPVEVLASPNRVWAVIQEPPTEFHRWLHRGQAGYARIYTSDPVLAGRGGRYHGNYPVLAWHVQRSFDELTASPAIPPKSKDISWITSTLAFLPGHRARMGLLARIRDSGLVDLYGRGLRPVQDKWEALAPYRYSIVFENHIGPHYWSEKLVDCYLAGCMPIYVGCTQLSSYFPDRSFIRFDPDADDPLGRLSAIVASTRAEDDRDSLIEARRRCLHELQLFPFMARAIASDSSPALPATRIRLRPRRLRHPLHFARAVWYFRGRPALGKIWKQAR